MLQARLVVPQSVFQVTVDRSRRQAAQGVDQPGVSENQNESENREDGGKNEGYGGE